MSDRVDLSLYVEAPYKAWEYEDLLGRKFTVLELHNFVKDYMMGIKPENFD